jgi:hypothetical protein
LLVAEMNAMEVFFLLNCTHLFKLIQVVKDNKGHADVPAIISTPHHYLISIFRNNLFFVAVCMSEGWYIFFLILAK